MTLSSEAVSSRLSDWSYCSDAMDAPWPARAETSKQKPVLARMSHGLRQGGEVPVMEPTHLPVSMSHTRAD